MYCLSMTFPLGVKNRVKSIDFIMVTLCTVDPTRPSFLYLCTCIEEFYLWSISFIERLALWMYQVWRQTSKGTSAQIWVPCCWGIARKWHRTAAWRILKTESTRMSVQATWKVGGWACCMTWRSRVCTGWGTTNQMNNKVVRQFPWVHIRRKGMTYSGKSRPGESTSPLRIKEGIALSVHSWTLTRRWKGNSTSPEATDSKFRRKIREHFVSAHRRRQPIKLRLSYRQSWE